VGQGGETADQGYLGLPAPYPEANHTGCGNTPTPRALQGCEPCSVSERHCCLLARGSPFPVVWWTSGSGALW